MFKFILSFIAVFNFLLSAPELVIGEERVEPGIVFIFEGVRDAFDPRKTFK